MAIAAFPFWSQILGSVPYDAAGAAAAAQSAAIAASQPLDADLTAIAALTGTNTIYYRSAANTWSPVTIGSGLTFSAGSLAATGGGGGAGLAANTFTGTQTIGLASGAASPLIINTPPGNVSGLNSTATYLTMVAGVNNAGVIRPVLGIWGQEQDDGAGHVNRTAQIGFNSGPSGTSTDTSQASNYFALEHYWLGQPETHLIHKMPDQTTIRVWSFTTNNSVKEPTGYFIGTSLDFRTRANDAGARNPHFIVTNPNTFSTMQLASYNGGLTAQYILAFSQATLNDTTINQTGTTAATGTINLNATKSVSINQAGIVVDVTQLSGAGQTTFNYDIKAAANTIGWQSNVVIKNSNNLLMSEDGALRWDAGAAGTWGAGRLIQFSGTNDLLLEGQLSTGNATFGLSHASAAGNVILKHKNTTVVNINSSLALSLGTSSGAVGFYGSNGAVKPTVTGSRGANAALASLLTALASLNILTDSSS